MAIIYTYPTKASPAADDLILISDSADNNKTKQIKVSALPSSGAGITLTTTGTSGVATLTGSVLNIPNYSTSPSLPLNGVQYRNANGNFEASSNLTFSTNTLAVTHTVDIKGDGTNAGKLKLYCENTTTPHAVTLEGPAHSGAAAYTLKLPSPAPSNQQILQSDGSGVLSWINTPSSGGGGYVDSVNTTDGTFVNLTPNSATTGAVTVTADLSATGTAGNTTFLRGDNQWAVPVGTTYSAGTGLVLNGTTFSLATGAALTNLGGGSGTTFLRKDGTWATPDDANTNIANSNLQLDNNRTLDFNFEGANKSLTFINTNGGSKNLFKFEQTTGTVPYFYVGHTESAYEGYVVLEGNGSNRTGQVQFENAAGTYYTSIKAPTTFGANQNIVYTLPNLQGSANSVLTNNGSGTLSWGSATEEASWTPTSPNANTISNASGKYTKVGNTVFASFAFTMTGSTSVALSGLPFSGVYSSANKGTSIISVNNCASVQGQLVGGQMATATSFIFNAYTGSGAGLPTKLQTTTSSLYQTSGGTYAGIIIYQTS